MIAFGFHIGYQKILILLKILLGIIDDRPCNFHTGLTSGYQRYNLIEIEMLMIQDSCNILPLSLSIIRSKSSLDLPKLIRGTILDGSYPLIFFRREGLCHKGSILSEEFFDKRILSSLLSQFSLEMIQGSIKEEKLIPLLIQKIESVESVWIGFLGLNSYHMSIS